MILPVLWGGCHQDEREQQDEGVLITVLDFEGKKIVLDKPAERIVCLYEAGLDALYMLHVEDKITAVFNDVYTSDELFPFYAEMDERIKKKELPAPGTGNQANVETVIRLVPDLVIVHANQSDLVQSLRSAGLQVYPVKAEKYDEVFKTVEDIGRLTAAEKRAEELIAYVKNEALTMQKHSGTIQQKKRVYFTWAYGRVLSTTGTNSMMHSCLEMAGVENVCPFEVDQPNINAETLIGWDPDMIVMWNDSPTVFYDRTEFAGIQAIKDKQIYNLLPMFFYNPHTLKALCTATAIHYWAYPEDVSEIETNQRVGNVIRSLYGKEKGDKILKL